MEDKQDSTAVDTGSDVDTSDDVDFSLDATDEPEEQTTSPAESDGAETSEESDESSDEAESTDDATEKPDDVAADESEAEKDSPRGMSKEERAEYFRNRQRARGQQIEQAVNEAYQPQPIDELTDYFKSQGHTDGESLLLARDEMREQQRQIDNARAQMAELDSFLAREAMEVVNTTPWLNSENKATYDAASADVVSQLYESLAIEKDDRTGQIVNAKLSPKQFYSLMDQVRKAGVKEAKAQARKEFEAEMASVAPPTSARQPVKSGNSISDMEDRLKDIKF